LKISVDFVLSVWTTRGGLQDLPGCGKICPADSAAPGRNCPIGMAFPRDKFRNSLKYHESGNWHGSCM
jgi:hypothetical protein